MELPDLRAKIRDIKNFPTEGILFKDISTLLEDGPAFRFVIEHLAERYRHERVETVVGIELRGFIFGGALAHCSSGGWCLSMGTSCHGDGAHGRGDRAAGGC